MREARIRVRLKTWRYASLEGAREARARDRAAGVLKSARNAVRHMAENDATAGFVLVAWDMKGSAIPYWQLGGPIQHQDVLAAFVAHRITATSGCDAALARLGALEPDPPAG